MEGPPVSLLVQNTRKPSEIEQRALAHSRCSGSDKNLDLWVTGPMLCHMPPGDVGNPSFRVCLLYSFPQSCASMFSHWCVVDELCSSVREGLSPFGGILRVEYYLASETHIFRACFKHVATFMMQR